MSLSDTGLLRRAPTLAFDEGRVGYLPLDFPSISLAVLLLGLWSRFPYPDQYALLKGQTNIRVLVT